MLGAGYLTFSRRWGPTTAERAPATRPLSRSGRLKKSVTPVILSARPHPIAVPPEAKDWVGQTSARTKTLAVYGCVCDLRS